MSVNMGSGTRIAYPHKLIKVLISEFPVGYKDRYTFWWSLRAQQPKGFGNNNNDTLEEGRRPQRPKRCHNIIKDVYNIRYLNSVNNMYFKSVCVIYLWLYVWVFLGLPC